MELKFDKEVLQNLDRGLNYEWMESNRLGAYASSTIVAMNTRREHGLLVVPESDSQHKIVVLSKFEESVFVENRLHEIAVNRYEDTVFPRGNEYLEKFETFPFPRFTYRIEDRILQKTVFLLSDQNILLVRYELRNQGKPVKLVIKPFIADRPSDQLGNEIQGLNTDSYLGQYFVRWAPRAEMPELYVYYSRGEYVSATLWYHKFSYVNDKNRYPDSNEDLFNPGFFQATLKPYQTLDLFVSSEEITNHDLDYNKLFRREAALKNYPVKNKTKNIFNSFNYRFNQSIDSSVAEGVLHISYQEPKSLLRDYIFTMPALLLEKNKWPVFRKLCKSILENRDHGLLPVHFPVTRKQPYFGAADLSLWIINLGYFYYRITNDMKFVEDELYDAFKEITDSYHKGTAYNIYAEKDGLIFCGDKSMSLSWVPLKTNEGEVLRYGKLLEINALWYNALRVMEYFSHKLDKKRPAGRFAKMAGKVRQSFKSEFVIPEKFAFYDFIQNSQKNNDFRINQIIPLALPFGISDNAFAKKVLYRIREELLTPHGLRSQSFNDRGYRPAPARHINRHSVEYYCGAIWPWTVSLYVQALINVDYDSYFQRTDLTDYFNPLFELVNEGLLGFIPESLWVNDKITQHGLADYLPGIANLLWASYLLNRGN